MALTVAPKAYIFPILARLEILLYLTHPKTGDGRSLLKEDAPLTATAKHGVPLSRIVYEFAPDYLGDLISDVLKCRTELPKGTRASLNSALKDCIRVDGFRNASRADPALLAPHVLAHFGEGNDRLVGAVLRAWKELEEELSDTVVKHLEEQGIPVSGPNLRQRSFVETWPTTEWKVQTEAILDSNDDLDGHDVRMMVCYVSGRAPESGGPQHDVGSPLLDQWLEELRRLPPEASEWEDVASFTELVADIAATKDAERALNLTASFSKELGATAREYEPELRYLEIDLLGWEADATKHPDWLYRALDIGRDLAANLTEYRLVQPQAGSRTEELERAVARAEREEAIQEIVDGWERLMEEINASERLLSDGGQDSSNGGSKSLGVGDQTETDGKAAKEDFDRLFAKCERLEEHCESLRLENEDLRKANKDLETDREMLSRENDVMRDDLTLSWSMEQGWRQAYVAAQVADAVEQDEPPPSNVNEAVSRAQKTFPNQLLLALNSKSDKNSAFLKPDEVFDALAWLATDYHQLRSNPLGKPPRFDELIKVSCPGWSYKPLQATLTKEMFNEWYRTDVNGRSYELGAHLGKGINHDPQTTIRIAFAWDEQEEKVIVGYIGLHQRSRLA